MNASAGTSRVPHLAMDGSRSLPVQERGSIGFQYHSSKIGRAPWPPTLDEPSCLASRARTILSRTTQRRSYHPRAPCRFVHILVKSGDIKGEAVA